MEYDKTNMSKNVIELKQVKGGDCMSGDKEPFFWHSNPEWYRKGKDGKYELTDKAPEEARKSLELANVSRSEKKNPYISLLFLLQSAITQPVRIKIGCIYHSSSHSDVSTISPNNVKNVVIR